MDYKLTDFLPTTKKECELRGWDELDVILFSGDAYVDHPSFGPAILGRMLEANGYRVAIVPQPDWHGDFRDFKKLGRPRLFFGVSPGAMDSMVNRYTAKPPCSSSQIDRSSIFSLNMYSLSGSDGCTKKLRNRSPSSVPLSNAFRNTKLFSSI